MNLPDGSKLEEPFVDVTVFYVEPLFVWGVSNSTSRPFSEWLDELKDADIVSQLCTKGHRAYGVQSHVNRIWDGSDLVRKLGRAMISLCAFTMLVLFVCVGLSLYCHDQHYMNYIMVGVVPLVMMAMVQMSVQWHYDTKRFRYQIASDMLSP